MLSLYQDVSHQTSRNFTRTYSTSFYSAINLLHKDYRQPICDIYGFVRLADEIVDTFHDWDKAKLLGDFTTQTHEAIDQKFSINPVLQSFQTTVHRYQIHRKLIDAFLHSMRLDLSKKKYDKVEELEEYIFGSAEVVGLMCLCVFSDGRHEEYQKLKPYAQKLGSAFQKINFLRDLKADTSQLHRHYFTGFDKNNFSTEQKKLIENDIANDFHEGLKGIKMLNWKARLGVYTAYKYYLALFDKIRSKSPDRILNERIRVPDYEKMWILIRAGLHHRLNRI